MFVLNRTTIYNRPVAATVATILKRYAHAFMVIFVDPGFWERCYSHICAYHSFPSHCLIKKIETNRKKKNSVLCYLVIIVGTWSTDFFRPVFSLPYVSRSSSVGTNPNAIHETDSIISINLVALT
jgi:hypothetical protein